MLNLIDITIITNRTDITALKIEFSMVNPDSSTLVGSSVSSMFHNLNDGDPFPCGNNQPSVFITGMPRCYYQKGDTTKLGYPASIIMTQFSYSGQINARLLIQNPTATGVFITVHIKAYAGTINTKSTYGMQYAGYWRFPYPFQTTVGTIENNGVTDTTTTYLYPNKGPWRDFTTWYISGFTPFGYSTPTN